MSKCHYCHGKGVLPGFDDSPGDSRFIFCSMCNATGEAQYADPTEQHGDPLIVDLCPACIGGGGSEDPATACPVCHGASFVRIDDAVCYCGELMEDHKPWGSCTSPVEMKHQPNEHITQEPSEGDE